MVPASPEGRRMAKQRPWEVSQTGALKLAGLFGLPLACAASSPVPWTEKCTGTSASGIRGRLFWQAAHLVEVLRATVHVYLTFQRSSAATDLTYIVQASGDLVDWSTVLATSVGGAATAGPGFVSEIGPAPTFLVEVRDIQPVNATAGSRRFLRLKVTSP